MNAPTYELSLAPHIADFGEELWNSLLRPDSSPFMEYAWLAALESEGCVGGETGWIPRHIALRSAGKLLALAPAYVKLHSEGEFVFDWQWANVSQRLGAPYYPKLIVAVPFTPATGDRILIAVGEDPAQVQQILGGALPQLVKQMNLSSAHVLFSGPTEANVLAEAGLMSRIGVQFHWRNQRYASFDAWLSTLGSKKKHQIKRERRLVREQGITIRTLRGAEIDEEVLQFAYKIYLSTVEKFSWGRRYLNEALFLQIAKTWAKTSELQPARAQLEIVVAEMEGRRIAGAINVAKAGHLYGRYWGCLEERPFVHFDVCFYHSIEESIARGFEVFEPGAGGEHKALRGFQPAKTFSSHIIRHARLEQVVRDHLIREHEAISAFVDGKGPDPDC